jgi:septal ring factor EnvC (AmiA/AmiB activator)
MPNQSIFLTKSFWAIFTIAVFVGLFLYGNKMIADKTEIAQTKKALEAARTDLAKCNQDTESKSSKIASLEKELEKQRNTVTEKDNVITEKDNLISQLNESIETLENKPPQIVYKYRTIYRWVNCDEGLNMDAQSPRDYSLSCTSCDTKHFKANIQFASSCVE